MEQSLFLLQQAQSKYFTGIAKYCDALATSIVLIVNNNNDSSE